MGGLKIFFIAVCVVVYVSFVLASPVLKEELEIEKGNIETAEILEGRSDRHRRVTCDLLSFGGKVNHSACAANCLRRGKAGGRCNKGICQCRKTKFKDLFG